MKKPIVDALAHHFCIADSQIYKLLKTIEISAASKEIRDIANSGESVHPSIIVEASRSRDPVKLVKKAVSEGLTAHQVRQEIRRERKKESPPIPKGSYEVVVVDPPWPIATIERECRPEKQLDYVTMPLDEIKALAIPAAPDCHLFLWTVHKFLPDAFAVLSAWEFKYSCMFTWLKDGGFQPFGAPGGFPMFNTTARVFVDTRVLRPAYAALRSQVPQQLLF